MVTEITKSIDELTPETGLKHVLINVQTFRIFIDFNVFKRYVQAN